MAAKGKAGWGFSGNQNTVIDTSQKEEIRKNIWEQNNEDLIYVPDITDEVKEQAEEGVDLSLLMQILSPVEDIKEKDEPWEFLKLKTQIYEIVSQMYGSNDLIEDDEENNEGPAIN